MLLMLIRIYRCVVGYVVCFGGVVCFYGVVLVCLLLCMEGVFVVYAFGLVNWLYLTIDVLGGLNIG